MIALRVGGFAGTGFPSASRAIQNPTIPQSNYPITRLPNYQISIAAVPGFTLIELLVVISLIMILATMGMTQYRSSVVHAREATLHEDLFRMRDAIDQYYADKGQYRARSTRW